MTPWTVARQAPLFMGFSRQEYWSGLPFPSPGELTNPGIEPGFPAWQADSLLSEPPAKPKSIPYPGLRQEAHRVTGVGVVGVVLNYPTMGNTQFPEGETRLERSNTILSIPGG